MVFRGTRVMEGTPVEATITEWRAPDIGMVKARTEFEGYVVELNLEP